MRTTSKPVVMAIREHVLEEFTKDSGWDSDDAVANLKEQINLMKYGNRTTYAIAKDWVEGGGALIYFGDVIDWLKTLNLDENRQYSEQESWDLYVHLLAREISKMVEA